MAAKSPRYLLREAVVYTILKRVRPGRFLEIGTGNGNFLLFMHKLGWQGQAYDNSAQARAVARQALAAAGVTGITVEDSMPEQGGFDAVCFFELLGYLEDPVDFLAALKPRLHANSRLVFSFTNSRHRGDAEKYSGDMACFDRHQVIAMLGAAGYRLDHLLNYGYPLSNMLRPLLNRHYRKRHRSGQSVSVADSGLEYARSGSSVSQLLCNRVTLWPFFLLQSLFRHTDLGTGYVVVATPGTDSGNEQDAGER